VFLATLAQVVGFAVAATTEDILALWTLYSELGHMYGSIIRNRYIKLVFVPIIHFTHGDLELIFAFGARLDVGVALHE
jgi:hypothetical protein